MTRRGKRRKGYRPPGTYREPDGSTTIIVREGDEIIKINRKTVNNGARSILEAAAAHDQAVVRSQPHTESIAPAVRTNSIPGQSSRNQKDYATGKEFSSRSHYEDYLKANHLVEMDAKDLGQAPAHSTREAPRFTRNLPCKDGKFEMPTTITPQTLMSAEVYRREFGGQVPAQVKIKVGK